MSYETFDNIHNELKIRFRHVASGHEVSFLPFITDFKDEYEQQWNPVEVFGRMDAIKNFKRTMRRITISFDVVSETAKEAEINMNKCSKLLKMNYPVYQSTVGNQGLPQGDPKVNEDTGKQNNSAVTELTNKTNKGVDLLQPQRGIKPASIMTAPPILQVKFANLINDGSDGFLYGTITGMTYAPDIEMGFWNKTNGTVKVRGENNTISFAETEVGLLPKAVSFTISFEVLHTTELGYSYEQRDNKNNLKSRNPSFPYKRYD